jgi:hypothetical protein
MFYSICFSCLIDQRYRQQPNLQENKIAARYICFLRDKRHRLFRCRQCRDLISYHFENGNWSEDRQSKD